MAPDGDRIQDNPVVTDGDKIQNSHVVPDGDRIRVSSQPSRPLRGSIVQLSSWVSSDSFCPSTLHSTRSQVRLRAMQDSGRSLV